MISKIVTPRARLEQARRTARRAAAANDPRRWNIAAKLLKRAIVSVANHRVMHDQL
ncbi:hypothetical protein EDF88_5015 [Buttiauxella sp. BIGb0552]|uniref:hypothetical protein n=1 Tax=Buttiauxella sp. BIGb0552 TaxID=2485120 RepID=UPI0010D71AE0|nr:hypothetical protein [Buttiauxella sp. BIGb0552]TDX09600.1 hypothetical protein EDF88_5015 [Buttiauxella sp. BIGb0552]